MDAISQARGQLLYPVLWERLQKLDQQCQDGPLAVKLRIVQGFRSWNDQEALYAQGRTAPGKIVTEARGGWSAHCFGYAADICPDDSAFPAWHPDWNQRDERWNTLLTNALNVGLAEGAQWRTFPDTPHLYLPELPATPDDEMRYLFHEKGLSGVWANWEGKFN